MAKKNKSRLHEWQLKGKEGGICQTCGRHVDKLTVDHIVPSSIIQTIDDSGEAIYEDEDLFQFMCHPCNQFKGQKLDKKHPKTKELLLKYL